tara:strand:+ start:832 stop:1542 length:711 start_codon:yes stop_codon:yes gene_type:complete
MVKRSKVQITTTLQNVNMKKPTGDQSIKKSGAWRYPNGVIQRAPSTTLNGKQYTDDKDPGEARRKHESNFFITLNTNRSLRDVDSSLDWIGKTACKKALEFLSRDDSIATYLKFGPKSEHYRKDCYDDVITKVEWQAAVEVGDELKRLHAHIWLTVHHYSQVQINMPVMQRMFKEAYNAALKEEAGAYTLKTGRPTDAFDKLKQNRNTYIQVKLLPSSDWAMVMKQYIHKAMMDTA